jgi:hypothetical protein
MSSAAAQAGRNMQYLCACRKKSYPSYGYCSQERRHHLGTIRPRELHPRNTVIAETLNLRTLADADADVLNRYHKSMTRRLLATARNLPRQCIPAESYAFSSHLFTAFLI